MKKNLTEEQKDGLAICADKAIMAQMEIAHQLRCEWEELCGRGRVSRGDAMDGESPCAALSLRISVVDAGIRELRSRADEIKAGAFSGNCNDCKKPIGFERLCKHPAATFCTVCGERNTPVTVKGHNNKTITVRTHAYAR